MDAWMLDALKVAGGAVPGAVLGFVVGRTNKALDRRLEKRARTPDFDVSWLGDGRFRATNVSPVVARLVCINLVPRRDLNVLPEPNPGRFTEFDPDRGMISFPSFPGYDVMPGDVVDFTLTRRNPEQRVLITWLTRKNSRFRSEQHGGKVVAVPWPEHTPMGDVGSP